MAFFDTILRRLGHTRSFRRVAPLVAGPLDRFLHRLSGGRVTVGGRVAPMLFLQHRGRRTGKRFATPLFHVRLDVGWVVVATNFGRGSHPAWSENLLAQPDVSVEVEGARHDVRARLATEDEWQRAWPELVRRWPAYESYERTTGPYRSIRMFVLEPRDAT